MAHQIHAGVKRTPVHHRVLTPYVLLIGSIVLIVGMVAALLDPRFSTLAVGWGIGAISSGAFFGAMIQALEDSPSDGRHARSGGRR